MKFQFHPNTNYKSPAIFGLFCFIILGAGSIAWANFAKISGAIIASGFIEVSGKPKSVQHLDGGIVKQIFVETGDRVEQGQLLVKLDATNLIANLNILGTRMRDAMMRNQRLFAELSDAETFEDPKPEPSLITIEDDFSAARKKQLALMKARYMTRQGQSKRLDEVIEQQGNQIEGLKNVIQEQLLQLRIISEEIQSITQLVEQNLTFKSRLLSLQRNEANMRGQIARNRAEVSRLKNAISEAEISKLQISREFQESVVTEIEQNDSLINELREQIIATSSQINRVEIRAPVSGIVHEMNLVTIGGVVAPGQLILQIIPQSQKFDIELNIGIDSVDQIYIGQASTIRLTAFNQRRTPELQGIVMQVSPSSVLDEQSGFAFYKIEVRLNEGELERLNGKKLVPGMPIEALLPTEERTIISYLSKPLTDHLIKALREE